MNEKQLIKFIVIMMALLIITLIIEGNVMKKKLEGSTSIKNQSNDWYWLQNQEYIQSQLNNYYKLKTILIDENCPNGGFVEEMNNQGDDFRVVCYEPSSTYNKVR